MYNLARILLTKGHINETSNFIEVNESCGNQVFSTEALFIKVSPASDNLQTEYNILKLLDKRYIPKPIFYEKIHVNGDVYYVIGISRLAGKTLEYWWPNMNLEEKNKLVENLIIGMKYINNIKNIQGIPNIYDSWREIINHGKYKTHPNIDVNSLESSLNKINFLIENIKNEQNYLVHNDIWYKNIIMNNNNFSGIIDFETAYLAPLRFEYYGLLLTNFYVFKTECSDSGEFEKEFCKMFLEALNTQYKNLPKLSNKEEFLIFCSVAYIKKLGQYEEEWYNHQEVLLFIDEIEQYAHSIF